MAQPNPQPATYTCTNCGQRFNSQNELQEHAKICKGKQQGGQPTR